MNWKHAVNATLARSTGYEFRKVGRTAGSRVDARRVAIAPRRGDRLLEQPGFVMCTLRSGSTLLRVLLDSHSQLHCPHEIHLRHLSVGIEGEWAERAMGEMGLDQEALEYLLWDRVLHRSLSASGKPRLVTKTPSDVFIADRIKTCWSDAKLIFLLRHPGAIVRSRERYQPEDAVAARNVRLIRRYCEALERARQTYEGLTIRYEDLTADPAATMQAVCEHVGVAFEPEMLDYGRQDHGRFRVGLGDWQEKIKSGRIQPAEPPPEVPAPLRPVAASWGYASDALAP